MSTAYLPLLLTLGAFLFGALPASRLVEALWRVQLREVGTGNVGAGNATRERGLGAGITLAVLDGLKGLLPVLGAKWLGVDQIVVAAAGMAAVVGNNWPIIRIDRGGRGLATSVGVVVGIAPILIVWPAIWSAIGWKIGGGPGGFIGWGLLPAFTFFVDPRAFLVVLTLGLAIAMIVRRAQGNAGYSTEGVVGRVLFDDDTRATAAPRRFGGIVLALIVLAAVPVIYLLLIDTFDVDVDWTPVMVGLLLTALGTEFAAKWAFGELFREGTMQVGTPVSRAGAFRAAMVATGVARLLPAGGAVTPAAMAWTVASEARGTSGAAVRATVLNYGGLSAATGFGLAWASAMHPAVSSLALTPIGLGLGVFGLALIGFGGKLGVLLSIVPERFRSRLEPILVDHSMTLRSWLLLTARVLLEAGTLGLTLIAFDLAIKPSQVLAAFGLSQLIGGLPGLPGGLGVTEAGLVGALAVFGVPAATAATPVIVFRVLSYWLPAVGGVIAGGGRFVRHTADSQDVAEVPSVA